MKTFSEIHPVLLSGGRIQRKGWNGKGLYVCRATDVIIPDVGYLEPFLFITTGSRRNTWVPSSADLEANDWVEYT